MYEITRLYPVNKRVWNSRIQKLVLSCNLSTQYLDNAEDAWILTIDDKLIGYVGVETCPITDNTHLQSLVIRKGYRKHGYGRALVEEVQKNISKKLFALTLFWNKAFYTKLGFRHVPVLDLKMSDKIASRPKHLHCMVLVWNP